MDKVCSGPSPHIFLTPSPRGKEEEVQPHVCPECASVLSIEPLCGPAVHTDSHTQHGGKAGDPEPESMDFVFYFIPYVSI